MDLNLYVLNVLMAHIRVYKNQFIINKNKHPVTGECLYISLTFDPFLFPILRPIYLSLALFSQPLYVCRFPSLPIYLYTFLSFSLSVLLSFYICTILTCPALGKAIVGMGEISEEYW